MARIGSPGAFVSSKPLNSPMNVDRINQVPVALFGRIAMPSTLPYWIPEIRVLMRLRQFRQAQKKSVGQYFADKRKPAAEATFRLIGRYAEGEKFVNKRLECLNKIGLSIEQR
jgi:hypothetical protein